MRKHNLYVIPRSAIECNQLASLAHSLDATCSGNSTFKVGQVAMFWQPKDYTAQFLVSVTDELVADIIEQVSVNELSQRLRG